MRTISEELLNLKIAHNLEITVPTMINASPIILYTKNTQFLMERALFVCNFNRDISLSLVSTISTFKAVLRSRKLL